MALRIALADLDCDHLSGIELRTLVLTGEFADVVGEWLVRLNLEMLTAARSDFVLNLNTGRKHECFGMSVVGGTHLEFTFHHDLLDRLAVLRSKGSRVKSPPVSGGPKESAP